MKSKTKTAREQAKQAERTKLRKLGLAHLSPKAQFTAKGDIEFTFVAPADLAKVTPEVLASHSPKHHPQPRARA